MRSIHKLQAAVATIMEKMDDDTLNDARIMYYSNQIIYEREENEKKMRISNKFLEFLKFQNAYRISYDHNARSNKFTVNYKRFDTFNLKKNLEKKETRISLSKDKSKVKRNRLSVSHKHHQCF